MVKEVSGKTAGEWIDSLVILEAKAMLKSSEQSIQEIADELHFANQSFFGKYFKHHTAFRPRNTGNSNIRQPPGSGKQIKTGQLRQESFPVLRVLPGYFFSVP